MKKERHDAVALRLLKPNEGTAGAVQQRASLLPSAVPEPMKRQHNSQHKQQQCA